MLLKVYFGNMKKVHFIQCFYILEVHIIQCYLRYILEVHSVQSFLGYILEKVYFTQWYLRYILEFGKDSILSNAFKVYFGSPFYQVLFKVYFEKVPFYPVLFKGNFFSSALRDIFWKKVHFIQCF